MTLFCNFFFQQWDIMFCWIQCFLAFVHYVWSSSFNVWCGMAGQAIALSFLFCTTCNLWLTSTSSALLLTALLHCFKHIKQCCWSFSLLDTDRHYLFPRIYVLFDPFPFMTLSCSKGQHSFMLLCFGMEVEPRCI